MYLYLTKIDHFSFISDDTFKMRYLVSQQFWDKNGGPIFFYTGNEGDITWFCENTVSKKKIKALDIIGNYSNQLFA